MASSKRVSIKLTRAQQAELKEATGRTGAAIELGLEELEERIAPFYPGTRAAVDGLADPRPSPMLGGDWVFVK